MHENETTETTDETVEPTDTTEGTTDPTPEPITPEIIEAWATEPENADRARALGLRLIKAKDADELRAQESLGEFEDRAIEWAIDNQMKARFLVMKLIAKIGTGNATD
jgi:hypothetical protein